MQKKILSKGTNSPKTLLNRQRHAQISVEQVSAEPKHTLTLRPHIHNYYLYS